MVHKEKDGTTLKTQLTSSNYCQIPYQVHFIYFVKFLSQINCQMCATIK